MVALPTYLLRDLVRRTPTYSTDAYGASTVTSWTDSTIKGRIDQNSRGEDLGEGRDAEVSMWTLFANVAVGPQDRVVDGAAVYEVQGEAWPVYAATSTVHHYEATLRRVEG